MFSSSRPAEPALVADQVKDLARAALLTGRVPIRTVNCSVSLPGQGEYGLAAWEYTLGELFSDAGYVTAAFG